MKFSSDASEENFSLSYANGISEDNNQLFIIKFNVSLQSSHGYLINLEYVAEFTSDESLNEQFMESPFLVVNAPAIAYPYLRSFISCITLNSGYVPAFLPTLNFQALANKKIKANNSSN